MSVGGWMAMGGRVGGGIILVSIIDTASIDWNCRNDHRNRETRKSKKAGWMYGELEGWRDACRVDEWMDGWMRGWMNEWMDGWMDGWTKRTTPMVF